MKEFKRLFFYGMIKNNEISITDSWKGGEDLIDLRNLKHGTKEVLLSYYIGKNDTQKVFHNRKEGLKYMKFKWGLE